MSASSPGEKRRRQAMRARERLAYEAAIAPLRVAGHSCSRCAHWDKASEPRKGGVCELDSDFHGYVYTAADDVCPHFKQRQT